MLLLYHLDLEWGTLMYHGTFCLHLVPSFTHTPTPCSSGWCLMLFSFLPPAPSSLCLHLPLPSKVEWVQSSHSWRSQQEWWQRQSCSILMSLCRDTFVTLHLLYGCSEELKETGHEPGRDIQETFRKDKCLPCLFCRQNANVGFSEAYEVAEQG